MWSKSAATLLIVLGLSFSNSPAVAQTQTGEEVAPKPNPLMVAIKSFCEREREQQEEALSEGERTRREFLKTGQLWKEIAHPKSTQKEPTHETAPIPPIF